jgi:hypothetical protein
MSGRGLGTLVLLACACAPPVRFYVQPPVWRESERRIAKPERRRVYVDWPSTRQLIFSRIDRGLSLEYGREAEDVNALDEVPDSSWYTDRRRDRADPGGPPRVLGPARVCWGAVEPDDLPRPPYQVIEGKPIGASAGFVVKDARGVRYLIKLDPPRRPGLATSTEVVVTRLAWAAGWHVPAEQMIALERADLGVAPDATYEDSLGQELRFDTAMLEKILAGTARRDDGSYPALASRWLPGESLGPWAYEGTRPDDPNDTIPHQHRRSVRAFGVFSAWVNNVDALENNTLDMFVDGTVIHYHQDVGGAFGTWAFGPAPYWMGREPYFDLPAMMRAIFTLGLWPREWATNPARREHLARVRAWPALAGFTADRFDARNWQPTVYNPAFGRQTARDRYWGAKRIAAFSPGEVRAAILAGWYEPAQADQLFEILWDRRRQILHAFLGDVTALDYFRLEAERICFTDLWAEAELGTARGYRADEEGRPLEVERHGPAAACVSLPPGAGYRVVALAAEPPDDRRPRPVRLHLFERAGQRRLVGIER